MSKYMKTPLYPKYIPMELNKFGTYVWRCHARSGDESKFDLMKHLVETGKKGEIIVDKRMVTSNKDIYAAGDVVGGIGTSPVGRMEGIVAGRNACGIASEAIRDL